MRQSIENIFCNNRYQRGIIIIDRRKSGEEEDIFYCYQPDLTRKCHEFPTKDPKKLLWR